MSRWSFAVVIISVAAAGVVFAAPHVVSQKARLFSPGAIAVKVGDEVVFKNDDTVTHHIYSATRGHEFELTTTEPRQDVRQTFKKAGRIEIRCGLHPGMRMIVTVK